MSPVELTEVINKLALLHLVGCLHYCINDARSHKHQFLLVANVSTEQFGRRGIVFYGIDLLRKRCTRY